MSVSAAYIVGPLVGGKLADPPSFHGSTMRRRSGRFALLVITTVSTAGFLGRPTDPRPQIGEL